MRATPPVYPPLLFVTALLFFGSGSYWWWRSLQTRRRVARLLASNEAEAPTLAEINARLFELNQTQTPHSFIFAARKRANRTFRGQRISLITGTISSCSMVYKGGYSCERRLFTIADDEQAKWMAANSDVFTPELSGSPFSIFWVELSALEAELGRD